MKFVENIEFSKWDNFVSNHKYSHFLHSYEWGEVSSQNRWQTFYVGLEENDQLVAAALLLKKNLYGNFSYFYIPRGFVIDYDDENLLKIFTEEINKFTKKHNSIYFIIDPDIKLHTIDKDAKIVEGENNYKLVSYLKKIGYKQKRLNKFFENQQPRFTFRVLLDNEENINQRYSKTVHRFIKKANFYNVEAYIGNKDDVKDFVRLMKLTEKRQNFYSHDEKYYDIFYDIFSKNNHVDVMLAKVNLANLVSICKKEIETVDNEEKAQKLKEQLAFYENEAKTKKEAITSGYFTVYYGNKAWYLYGANDLDYKNTMSNYKLFDFQIKTALLKLDKNKQNIFDEFGTVGDPNTKNKLGGLHEFKKKFGGEYTEFIGEFEYVQNPLMYAAYKVILPIRRYFVRKKLHKKGK